MTRAVVLDVERRFPSFIHDGEYVFSFRYKVLRRGRKKARWDPLFARDELEAYMQAMQYLQKRGYKV